MKLTQTTSFMSQSNDYYKPDLILPIHEKESKHKYLICVGEKTLDSLILTVL